METPRRLTFGANADAYERARPEWPAAAAAWLAPGDPELVVELGAGTGKLTRALAALGLPVLAVEPDPRMLDVLRGLGLDGVEGSAEAIPLGDGEAGAVVAGSAFHWFDLELALPEIRRVLRSGGTLGFGWNHRDTASESVAAMSAEIGSVRVGESWHGHDWAALVTAGGLFREVEQARFPHLLELPQDALEDHLLSFSGLAALPDGERVELFGRIAAILDADPDIRGGETYALPFVVDAYRTVTA